LCITSPQHLAVGLGRGRAPLSLTCSRVCGTSSYAAPEAPHSRAPTTLTPPFPSSPPYLYLSPSHRAPRPRRRAPPRPRSRRPPSPARALARPRPRGARCRRVAVALAASAGPSPLTVPRRRPPLTLAAGAASRPSQVISASRERRHGGRGWRALLLQTCAYDTSTTCPAGTTASRPTSGRSACASSPSCSASSLWKRRARRTRSARDHPRVAPARDRAGAELVCRETTQIRPSGLSPPRGAGQRQGPALRGAQARAAGEPLIRRVHPLPVPPRGQALAGSDGARLPEITRGYPRVPERPPL